MSLQKEAAQAIRSLIGEKKALREKVAELENTLAEQEKRAAAHKLANEMKERGIIEESDFEAQVSGLENEDLEVTKKAFDLVTSVKGIGELEKDAGDSESVEEVDPLTKLCLKHLGMD